MSESRIKDATLHAEKLVRDKKLELPIDLKALANDSGIILQPKPDTAEGVSGLLIRHGNDFAIGYATHIKSEGFQRFSIAHEMGHYFLPGHFEHVFKSGNQIHESRAGFGSRDQIELEADHFAAGLLMPAHLFKSQAGKYSDGFIAVEKLSEICKTSLTAAAIRYAELSDAAVAIIISTGSTVDYCFTSNSLRQIKGYRHPIKGSTIPRDSLTRNFNRDKNNIIDAERSDDSADTIAWFHSDDEIDASEEVIGLGEYGKTLTIITAEIIDEDDY